ncbi:MAG: TonB-dependent receptor plug domain-containing protein, partial [Pseudomonadales bacterium]
MRILLPLLAALATPAPVVLAAEPAPAPGLEETLVVTGSRIESPPEAIPAHVTIIDRATIEARQPQSTLDLLRSVAGLQVSQYGGRGGITSVFIRGAEPNFTVVLIDGVQVNDPNNSRGGSFDFSTLNVAEIERIEIVRGAQSSLYGSDALAGVIQIITRKPEGTARVSIDAEAGEDEFYRGALHLAGALGESTQASFTASAADDGNAIDGNSFENRTLSGRLSSTPTQALSLALAARYADSEATAFPEDSGGPDLAVLRALDSRDQTQLSLNGTAGYQASGRVRLSAQLGFVNHDEKTASPGIAPGVRDGVPPNRSDSELERFSAALSATAQLSASADAVVGVDYEDESGSLDGTLELAPGFALPTDFNLDRHILGLFVELRAAPTDALALSASV